MRYLSCPVKNATLLRMKEWINEIATSPNQKNGWAPRNDGAGKSSKPPKHLFLKEETIPGYQFSSSSGAEKAA